MGRLENIPTNNECTCTYVRVGNLHKCKSLRRRQSRSTKARKTILLDGVSMRSVVIAFLVWQCFLHKLACTATESTMTEVTSSGQVFSDAKAASDQKEAVGGKESVHTLADPETSGETPRSEPLVGRGRIAQISSATDVEASPVSCSNAVLVLLPFVIIDSIRFHSM